MLECRDALLMVLNLILLRIKVIVQILSKYQKNMDMFNMDVWPFESEL